MIATAVEAAANMCGYLINPLSAMAAIWHHIIVSFQVLGTERVHWNLDITG
jgi:hypothetical protein